MNKGYHFSQNLAGSTIGHAQEESSGPLHPKGGSHFISGKVTVLN